MKLASTQFIKEVIKHPNADKLDIATVLNYKAVVNRDQWKVGDVCIFIEPDSVLPDKPWASFYKSKSNRVKAIKLRGEWSFGIVESFKNVFGENSIIPTSFLDEGTDLTNELNIIKYEPPVPQDLAAAGPYKLGIPKTDEEKWQSLDNVPYGEIVDVTLKIDGQSWSAFDKGENGESENGIGGRSFVYKLDSVNNYTKNNQQFNVLYKLKKFCLEHNVNLCIRGEQYGAGIQKSNVNHHAKSPLSLAFYSTWLIDERRYARKGEPYYIHNITKELDLPTVTILEKDVILTPELIKKYDEDLESIDGKPFEGVVIQWNGGSFKVINKYYDSKK